MLKRTCLRIKYGGFGKLSRLTKIANMEFHLTLN